MTYSRLRDFIFLNKFLAVLCFLPLIFLLWRLFWGDSLVNPVEEMTHSTGWWALTLLTLTLTITPLKIIMGIPKLIIFRRTLGLFSFLYASLHFFIWIIIDQFLSWKEILLDVLERPFITVGFGAFILMVPLAVTSWTPIKKKISYAFWTKLHNLIYPVAVLALIHFLWLVKKDKTEPLIYILIIFCLFTVRFTRWFWKRILNK